MTRSDCVLIQQASGDHKRLLALTQHLHNQYCERHQIDYWCFYGCPVDIGDRAPNWPRVKLMQQAQAAGYTFIVWLDADCLIVGDADLREACARPGFNMTWHDMSAWKQEGIYDHWSTGAVYIKSYKSLAVDLDAWWDRSDEGHGWADQNAFNLVARDMAIRAPHSIDPKWNSIHPHFLSPEPAVMAWHGFGDVDLRYRAMAAEINKRAPNPAIGESERALQERSDKFLSAMTGAPEDTEAGLRAILAEKPDEPEVLRELAQIVGLRGDMDEAERLARLSVAYEPNVGSTWCMLGALAAGRGDNEEAGRCYERALHFSPHMPIAHRNRALHRLLLGDYAGGFQEDWEWGRVAKQRRLRFPASTEWRVHYETERLLVWSDQGAGDVMMFWRFLRKLRKRLPDTLITWEVHDGLVGLAAQERSVNTVVKLQLDGGMPVEFDAHIELGDLPLFLGLTGPEDFTITEPYICADPAAVERWRKQITPDGFRAGLVWSGNPNHPNDANRSMSFREIAPILGVPGATFYSLQLGAKEGAAMLNTLPIRSWDDTAAIIECLDVVVAVDTGVAHLAGAMGQKVITLLPFSGDWRWGVSGEETPWYPSMTLLRQSRLGDWTEPVMRAAAALEVMAHA